MSLDERCRWLLSHRHDSKMSFESSNEKFLKAKVVSITSGKGGVGKTTISLGLAKQLAKTFKVLVIDCDFNLSNTLLKLNLPLSDKFLKYVKGDSTLFQSLERVDGFDLLAGANGEEKLVDNEDDLKNIIYSTLNQVEDMYDFILLDCPAGAEKSSLSLNAFSDHRVFIVTPDKASITDSYSLMKLLKNKFGVSENHLLINKARNEKQYKRIVKNLGDTTAHYLNISLKSIGAMPYFEDLMDNYNLEEDFSSQRSFLNNILRISKQLSDELAGGSFPSFGNKKANDLSKNFEHDVQL